MVDGHSSTLPTSERLQRLREYASRFRHGKFDRENVLAYPENACQLRHLPLDCGHFLSTWYNTQHDQFDFFLSSFTPGSTYAGIKSNRCVLHIGTADRRGLAITQWAIDDTQDLVVTAETGRRYGITSEKLECRCVTFPMHIIADLTYFYFSPEEFRIQFYSLSSSSKTTELTPHPAAVLPSLHFLPVSGGLVDDLQPRAEIVEMHIAGPYVIWQLSFAFHSTFAEVCNWRTDEVISVRTSPLPSTT